MMKKILAVTISLALGCTGGAVVTSPDPCLEYGFQNPACDSGYSWNPGYFNDSHIWIRPHYVRRSVIVTPVVPYHPPVVVSPPVVVNRTVVVPAPVVRTRTYVVPTRTVTRPTPAPRPSGSSTLRLNGRRVR